MCPNMIWIFGASGFFTGKCWEIDLRDGRMDFNSWDPWGLLSFLDVFGKVNVWLR